MFLHGRSSPCLPMFLSLLDKPLKLYMLTGFFQLNLKKTVFLQFSFSLNTYMLFAGWKVRMRKAVTEGLRMLPEAAGRGQHFQTQGHSLSLYGPNLSRQITFIFFPAVNWLYSLQMRLFTQLLPFNGLARRLPTICKKSWQRTSHSDSRQRKDVLKNRIYVSCFYFTD